MPRFKSFKFTDFKNTKLGDIKPHLPTIVPIVSAVIVVALFIFVFYRLSSLSGSVIALQNELSSTTNALVEKNREVIQNIADIRSQTSGLSNTLSSAQQNIDAVRKQVGGVEQTVGSISGSVDTLQKLSRIDQELLIKYSKVYFLNENYKPLNLANIPSEYAYSDLRKERILPEVLTRLMDLLDSAKNNGITIYVKSAYRSFAEQQSLKSLYSVVYGAGANAFSADQGYSEHQLGTTVDLITTGLGGQLDGFDKTIAFRWLNENAYRFGFILSYPKGNQFYVYEPWHWRFVGVKLAKYLKETGKNFYDLDQREIDTYLINIFD